MKIKKELKNCIVYARVNEDLMNKCLEIGNNQGIDNLSMIIRISMLEYIKNHSKANMNVSEGVNYEERE